MEHHMKLTKSTKNTHVYEDDSENSAVPTLYIKKRALPDPPPEQIIVTIRAK